MMKRHLVTMWNLIMTMRHLITMKRHLIMTMRHLIEHFIEHLIKLR